MTDDEAIQWLIRKKNFTPKAARRCFEHFKETMIFAGLMKEEPGKLEITSGERSDDF